MLGLVCLSWCKYGSTSISCNWSPFTALHVRHVLQRSDSPSLFDRSAFCAANCRFNVWFRSVHSQVCVFPKQRHAWGSDYLLKKLGRGIPGPFFGAAVARSVPPLENDYKSSVFLSPRSKTLINVTFFVPPLKTPYKRSVFLSPRSIPLKKHL